MERKRTYRGGILSVQGWRQLVELGERTFKVPLKSTTSTIHEDNGHWGYHNIDDFIVGVVPKRSDIWLYYDDRLSLNINDSIEHLQWTVHNATKAQIIYFEQEADKLISAHWTAHKKAIDEPKEVVVFIGHGRSPDWRDLKDHLSDKHGIRVEAYETGARAGHAIINVLQDMLNVATLAILVHTPEDELADGTFNSRPNVIHETGLFQGRLGFHKAIVLLKHRTEEFSNLAGTQEYRYTQIKETFGDVLAWMKREGAAV